MDYQNGMIIKLKTDADKHKEAILKYQKNQQQNLDDVKSVMGAPVDNIKTQI